MADDNVEKQFPGAPPSYNELTGFVRDFFENYYYAGMIQVDVKTITCSDIEFNCCVNHQMDTTYTLGSLQTKYAMPDLGISFMERWKTNNTLFAELSLEDYFLKGLQVIGSCIFEPYTGKKSGVARLAIKKNYFHINLDMEALDDENCSYAVIGSVVARLKCPLKCPGADAPAFDNEKFHNFLGGYQMAYDLQKRKITHSHIALGYYTSHFVLYTTVEDAINFGAAVYQKINPYVEAGVLVDWNSLENSAYCSLGWIYHVNCFTDVRAKMNNKSQLAFSCTHKLRPEILMTMSASFASGSCDGGNQKFGCGIEFFA